VNTLLFSRLIPGMRKEQRRGRRIFLVNKFGLI
jgi:hypothetical protein